MHTVAFTTRELTDLLLLVAAFEIELSNISTRLNCTLAKLNFFHAVRDNLPNGLFVVQRITRLINIAKLYGVPNVKFAGILGFIETLADPELGKDVETRQRFLKIMDGEARRMQRLIDDLISLSRIEAEKYRAPDSPVDLSELVAEVVGVFRSSHGERGRDDDGPNYRGRRATRRRASRASGRCPWFWDGCPWKMCCASSLVLY